MNTFLGAAQMLRAGRGRRGACRGREDPLPRRLSVGPGRRRAPRCTRRWTRRAPPGTQGRLHLVRQLRRRSPPRRLRAAARRAADRHPVRQRGRDRGAGRRGDVESAVAALKRQGRDPGRHAQRAWRARRRAAASAPKSRPSRSRELVDTTGAGDLFAAGFLAGEARGLGLEQSLRLGAICAAEVIQHYGARPEADLRALAGDLLA